MTKSTRPIELRRLTPDFAVSGQIWPDQVADLSTDGFTAIICNRPDGEVPDQPTASQIESAAREAGLTFYNIPVSPVGMSYENVDHIKEVLEKEGGPILAYCRSGARSTHLWQFVQQQSD